MWKFWTRIRSAQILEAQDASCRTQRIHQLEKAKKESVRNSWWTIKIERSA